MNILWLTISSNVLISLIALIGIIFILFKKISDKVIFGLIAFSAGILLSGAFLHLLPEAIKEIKHAYFACTYTLLGFILFFFTEKVFHWHHCRDKEGTTTNTVAYLNLIGDAIHNFLDGLIIAASYSVSISFGIITCIAIIMHEIPQEIGDFGVLIYYGLNKVKALWLNFLVALTSVIGGIIGYFLSEQISFMVPLLLALAAGGFIYISSADLIPELKKQEKIKKPKTVFALFILGILIMWLNKFILPI